MLLPALIAFAIVPMGGTITVAHHTTRLQLADPQWGILFLLMCSGVSVYGVLLAGWASGSKYPLLGSVRASAQMISYEAVLGLTTATVVVVTGSLHTSAIVAAQHGGFLYKWNLIHTAVIPFVLFTIAITAEMTRPPFDLVEAEEELSGGYNLEYSATGFMWFYMAEYTALVTNSAIIATLWLGGPDGPRIAGNSIGPFWFVLKVLIILYVYVWVRATLPRLRYDQLMDLGWKWLIPGALAMLMIIAGFQVEYRTTGSGFAHALRDRVWGLVAIGAALVLGALFVRARDVGRQATEVEAAQEARMAREAEG
jgi:NADH-quinone oxidoreductase subunit H